MRHYEGLFILDPVMAEDKLKEKLQNIQDGIKQFKGKVEKIEEWGQKKLHHSIKGKKEAKFYLIYFSVPRDTLGELRKLYQMKEGILRFSIFKREGEKNGQS